MARELTVTIKYGKGYEETWAVFKGMVTEVREDIIAYFGIDSASVAGQTLSELVVNATSIAHGKGNVAATLGAVAIPASDQGNQDSAPAQGQDVWAQAEAAAQQQPPAVNPLFAQIEACGDVGALQRLWAENQAAFADAEVMAAWKAKGKALQGVAA